jgi:dTDP-4-amino-4,6-dideoxygalactose transaminase
VCLDADNARRKQSVQWLAERLRQSNGLVPLPARSGTEPVYYKLGLQYDPAAFAGLDRDRFVGACRAEGIALDVGFRALHVTHSRRRYRAADPLAVAAAADQAAVTLHHPVLLGDQSDLAEIVAAVERVRRHAAAIQKHLSEGHP